MEGKPFQITTVLMFIISFFMCNPLNATTWFVRPHGEVYGLGDGTSYENAWNQLTYQEWYYIQPGDTVYICGLYIANWVFIKKSGTINIPITIRGDYEQESGTILAASSVYDSLWVPIDSVNNIWTQTWELNEPFPTYLCFEKNDTSGVEGIVPLKRVFDINFSFWESGSFYYDEMDSLIYYKPSGSDANDYVFYTNGYAPIVAQGQNNINILNIDLIGGYHAGISLEGSPKNVIIDGVSIKWSSWSGITFYPSWENDSVLAIPSENITIRNSVIHDTKCGIYPYGMIRNIKIFNNTIYNIDPNALYGNRDTHAIGLQGAADSLLIEHNHIHHGGGEGIVLYYDDRWTGMGNVTIRYNKIHDIYTNNENMMSTRRGIDFGHGFLSTEQLSEVYNDSIYYNIIYNIGQNNIQQPEDELWKGQGIRIKSVENPTTNTPTWYIYNNTIDNCNIGFSQYFGWEATNDTLNIIPAFDFKNNIITNSYSKHIALNLRGVTYDRFYLDNNLYFPDGDSMFVAPDFGQGDFSSWKSWNYQYGREQNSISEPPLYFDISTSDYHPTQNSPMVDLGLYLGITMDFDGNIVPQGNGPDIGAFESEYTVSIASSFFSPVGYKLNSNYPNPFNPVTTISYQLPKSGFVYLAIYNISGQLVETLVNEYNNAGYHSVVWNARGIGSGLYLYRIKAGEYTETKKCLILK